MEEATRPKRNRAQTSKASGSGGENQDMAPSEASEGQAEREASPDDFEDFRPKPKRNRTAEGSSVAPDQSLIEIIKGNGKQIPRVVKLWVERYEKYPKSAMVELWTMLFEACGAKFFIKEESLDETDVDDVVVALVALAKSVSCISAYFDLAPCCSSFCFLVINMFLKGEVEDYQSSKRKDLKNFRDNLISFWDNLIAECQNGPLFDKVLFDKCMDYIIALSCTPPRVYRQVATLIGLQLVTSFINIAKTLGAQRETTQRQLNAEKKKRTEGPRLESLNKRLSTTHDQILVLEDMMRRIFTGLFVHRYRDIDPTIRMSCIESLGVWILSYPSLFLQDLYLKYLGWTLNDKNAGVRKASILALQSLYDVDDNVPTLSLFTERFSNRMIELADDVDISVAVCAIGLVKQLLRHQLLPDDDLGPLYDLLIDDPAEIRRAIGELVYDHLIAQKFNTTQSGSRGNDSSEVHLSRMLQILREFSTDPILSTYVIDDVWEYMKAMKDWKCIISMLLDENALIELTDDDATNLVRLLFASVRKAVGERIVPASDNRKQFYNKAQKETFETSRRNITIAMMKNYPPILRKFMADKAKISSLVEIIVYLNLELYSLKRQEQDGDEYSLLVNLKRLYELQLSRAVPIDNFYKDLVQVLHSFRNVDDEVVSFLLLNMYLHVAWSLQSIVSSETVDKASLTSLLSKRNILFEELEYFLGIVSENEDGVKCGNHLACRVCIILAEAWCLFKQANFSSTKLASLGYYPDISTIQKFWRLCEQQLNVSDETEDEDANKEYIEETNRDAVIIAAAKLVVNDTVSKESLSPEIISHFVMHGTSVAEIVKHLISVLRKKDVDVPSIFLEAMKRAHHRYLVDLSSSSDQSSSAKSFQDCKDLAARLSGTFMGAARNKHRSDILKIVKDGIEYAFIDAPKQLSFLEAGVLQFVTKLPIVDVQEILKYVQSQTENVNTDENPSGWRPYHTFVDTLREKYARNEGLAVIKSIMSTKEDGVNQIEGMKTMEDEDGANICYYAADEKEGTTGRRRGRPRKSRNIEGKRLFDEHGSSEEEDSISASDRDDVQDEEEENEDEDEEVPLIHTLKSASKLRSLRVPRDENKGQTRTGASASRTSGMKSIYSVVM
ncbi:hypothetical protein Tsubulata_035680 [Turnera subulata]|uniref:SCD domain-containing protein n=1 Tax=Turnera subulata TaxID=218843 RepID=A0A9Q0J6N7_9ROSI|nr:hypothetical protein Tsubulata_035680 [Turnera subulata]